MSLPRRIGQYHLTGRLGKGQFGEVFRGTNAQGEPVAAKCVSKQLISPRFQAQLEAEIAVLRQVVSPYVIQLYDALSSDNNYYLIMECCDGSDMEKMIAQNVTVPLHLARRWLTEIVDAFLALRANHVMHRDLKPANVLLTNPDPEKAHVKLADFGFAKFSSSEEALVRSIVGSPLYMAPEICLKRPYNSKIDVWSFGVLASKLLNTKLFDDVVTMQGLQQRQLHPEFHKVTLPADAMDMLSRALTYDPQQRPSFEQLRTLPFFQAAFVPLSPGSPGSFTLSSLPLTYSNGLGATDVYLEMSCKLHTNLKGLWDLGWEMDRNRKFLLAFVLFQLYLWEVTNYQTDIQSRLTEHEDSSLRALIQEAGTALREAQTAVQTAVSLLSASDLAIAQQYSHSKHLTDVRFIREEAERMMQFPALCEVAEKQKRCYDAVFLLVIARDEGRDQTAQARIDELTDIALDLPTD